MIPSNPPSTTTSKLPAEPPAVSGSIPADLANNPTLPPVKGSLPYSRQEYEQLPDEDKTPELDFLILGKIPGGRQSPSDPPLPYDMDFNDTVVYCLIGGETEALDFLWRESGRDPGKIPVDLTSMSMDRDTVTALVKHCADQPNLKVDLCLRGQNADVIDEVSRLAAEGKVNRLLLFDLPADGLERLASVAGKVRDELQVYNTPFGNNTLISTRCEQELAEAFRDSKSLATVRLAQCSFGESQGKYFIQGMRENNSITELEMNNTPLPTTSDSGYRTLLDGNKTLRKLTVLHGVRQPLPDIDVIITGLLNNDTLSELQIRASGHVQVNLKNVCQLLENNRALTTLSFPANLAADEAFKALAASLAKNTSLTTFSVGDAWPSTYDFASVVNDLIDRNRALASDTSYLQKAGRAFDPSGTSGIADPGALIAQEIFRLSSNRNEFETIMTEVELSIREQEKQGTETVTATTTTDTATNTTTTTTTTAMPPSGSPSS